MDHLRDGAVDIVEWVLGVRVTYSRQHLHDGELTERGNPVGSLLVAGAVRRGRFSWHQGSVLPAATLVNDLVESEAWRTQVRTRLGVSPPLAGNLFVWVDDRDRRTRAAMERDEPPGPPKLPPEVAVAWVARRAVDDDRLIADRVWQTGESREWEALGPIARPLSSARS
ncbi:MAG: hypothetical protein ACRD12_24650 [Acidimicrobiales bacterium]